MSDESVNGAAVSREEEVEFATNTTVDGRAKQKEGRRKGVY